MIHRIGDRERFSIEIGQVLSGDPATGLRVVELWAAGREMTCDCNAAFVPSFSVSVEAAVSRILSDNHFSFPYPDLTPAENHRRLRSDAETDNTDYRWYRFMDWGPTTDNVSSLLFRRGHDVVVTFEFWRETHPRPDELGQVYVVELPERSLLRYLHDAVCVLRRGT